MVAHRADIKRYYGWLTNLALAGRWAVLSSVGIWSMLKKAPLL